MDLIDITQGWLTDWGKTGGPVKEWLRDMHLDAINHGWFDTLWHQPVYWWRSVKHVVSWMPFLWDDRDWDHVYAWRMHREKLKRMRKHHEREKLIADWAKVSFEIFQAERMLTRLIDDAYTDADWDAHTAKYGSIWDRKIYHPDGTIELPGNPDPACGEDVRRIGDKHEAMVQADLDALGQHMAKYCRGWWS